MPSYLTLSSRYAKSSPAQLRHKQEIDNLLKKYSKIRIPKESRENQGQNQNRIRQEGKNVFQISNSNQLKEQQQQSLNYQREEAQQIATSRTKHSKRTKEIATNSNVSLNNSNPGNELDYGLAKAASEYVAKILAQEEPECQQEREQIIRKNFLQNFANDFKLKQNDDENYPFIGKIRVIIRHRKPSVAKKLVEKRPVKVQQQEQRVQEQQNTVSMVTKSRVNTTQSVVVKREVIKMPTIKTTRVVKVKKIKA